MVFESFISDLVIGLSYFGVFLASGLVSISIVFPLPWYPITLGAVILKLNPIITSLMFASGSMVGELICYNIGAGGRFIAKKKFKNWKKSKKLVKLISLIENHFKKHGFLTIFITALIFFPFDIVSMIAGANRYDIKKYLIAGFLGKFLKMLIIMILTIEGISYFGIF